MTHNNSFSITEVIKYAWETFKKNWAFLIKVFLIIFLVSILPSWLYDWSSENLPILRPFFSIAGWIIQLVTSVGLIVISLKVIDHKTALIEDIYKHSGFVLNYFLSSFIYFLIVIGGLLLLVIPGIYFAIKYSFYGYFVVDKKMGPWEAIKESGKITEGIKLKLIGFWMVSFSIIILGAIFFGIGLIIAIPVVTLAEAYLYRKLSHKE